MARRRQDRDSQSYVSNHMITRDEAAGAAVVTGIVGLCLGSWLL